MVYSTLLHPLLYFIFCMLSTVCYMLYVICCMLSSVLLSSVLLSSVCYLLYVIFCTVILCMLSSVLLSSVCYLLYCYLLYCYLLYLSAVCYLLYCYLLYVICCMLSSVQLCFIQFSNALSYTIYLQSSPACTPASTAKHTSGAPIIDPPMTRSSFKPANM